MAEMDTLKETSYKLTFESAYMSPGITGDVVKQPARQFFAKAHTLDGPEMEAKILAHIPQSVAIADIRHAVFHAISEVETGGYITVEIKVVNP